MRAMLAGWCVWFFTVLAGAALLIVNTKLVHIVRYVTRGGHVHRLKPGVFWLNRCVPCAIFICAPRLPVLCAPGRQGIPSLERCCREL